MFSLTFPFLQPAKEPESTVLEAIPSPRYISNGTFETQVRQLINEEDLDGPMITNPFLAKLAEISIQVRYANQEAMQRLLDKGDKWLFRQIAKEKSPEKLNDLELGWLLLAELIFEEKERMAAPI